MSLSEPQIFVSPRPARFFGYRRLPQFVRRKKQMLDIHMLGFWFVTIAWLAPAKKARLA